MKKRNHLWTSEFLNNCVLASVEFRAVVKCQLEFARVQNILIIYFSSCSDEFAEYIKGTLIQEKTDYRRAGTVDLAQAHNFLHNNVVLS